jgi:phosphoglycolate phosphatase-like HAD superfamily hydrolase
MQANQEILKNFQPKHNFFIGFDSDGCVFDTMEIKQKECFCPNNIKYWGLQPVSKYAREATEFVNLYSKWRGANRFPALVRVFDFLADRDEVKARGFKAPDVQSLRDWINSGVPLGNNTLKEAAERSGDPVLKRAYEWTTAVNKSVEEIVYGIPPYPYVRESLEKLAKRADLICVSQTPSEALEREWAEHDIAKYAAIIAGQELGTKKEHLKLGAVGKYPANHILMVGDAQGDLEAAKANGVLFYPINPGHEEDSWKRFHGEALDLFFNEKYEGEYEAKVIKEFQAYLPETPPWGK